MVEIVVSERERCVVVNADVVKSNSTSVRARNPGLDLRREVWKREVHCSCELDRPGSALHVPGRRRGWTLRRLPMRSL